QDCAGVREAVVVVRPNELGLPRALAAYVELLPDVRGLLPRHLSAALRQRLPTHMRPSAIVLMQELPRLPTEKVDRERIARIDAERPTASIERSSDPFIDEVAKVFEAVLEVERAIPDDNLLSLGGNSLQAVDVALAL